MRLKGLLVVGLLLAAQPALAQMGGMGGMDGVPMGPPPEDGEGDGGGAGGAMRPREAKPIPQERFDQAVTAMFVLADTNRDGMVTLGELQAVIDARREKVIAARFAALDTNGDGRIDQAEFVAWQRRLGSAASTECAAYTGQNEIVPETLGPPLGESQRDRVLGALIEPLSAMVLTKANIHYAPGITLKDLLAYEDARFAAADANKDGFIDAVEQRAVMHMGPDDGGPARPAGAAPREGRHGGGRHGGGMGGGMGGG